MSCTVYIDESGDAGVKKIRSQEQSGSSEYFILGAVVIQPATQIRIRKKLDELQGDFRKTKRWKHATDLNHMQKVHFCREMSKEHVRFFGLISYKPTLGEYGQSIDHEPDKFYNKCAVYLLEKVGKYLRGVSPSIVDPKIVFERRNHDYDAMIRYVGKVKDNPLDPEARYLENINPYAIVSRSKSEEDLLRVADLVSHALYCCVNKTPDNFGITETRYLRELAKRFAVDDKGKVLGTGIKPIHSLVDLNLDSDVNETLRQLRAAPRPQSKRS